MTHTMKMMTALIAVGYHQPVFAAPDSQGLTTCALDFDAKMTMAPASDHTLGGPIGGNIADPKRGVVHQASSETGSGFADFDQTAKKLERGQIDNHDDDASTAMDITEEPAAL